MAKPELGWRVSVRYALDPDTPKHGVVIELLDKQFTYIDQEEHVHYAFYADDWWRAVEPHTV